MDIKNSENETEETESVTEKRRTKRVDLDENDSLTKVIFNISKKHLKELKLEAVNRGVSMAFILRELIKERRTKEKPSSETETLIIEDADLEELLNSCFDFFGSFITTGDDGFFVKFAYAEWKLSQLTTSQYIAVLNYLRKGYNGFYSPPTIPDFLQWIRDIDGSDEQLELAELTLENNVNFTDEDVGKSIDELIKEIESQVESEEQEEKEATGEKALEESEKPSEKKPYWKLSEE